MSKVSSHQISSQSIRQVTSRPSQLLPAKAPLHFAMVAEPVLHTYRLPVPAVMHDAGIALTLQFSVAIEEQDEPPHSLDVQIQWGRRKNKTGLQHCKMSRMLS